MKVLCKKTDCNANIDEMCGRGLIGIDDNLKCTGYFKKSKGKLQTK